MATIFEAIQATGSFRSFISGLEQTGLVTTLREAGPWTVFVPTEEAFARVDPQKRDALFAKGKKLTKVMQYHIAPGFYTASDLLDHLFLKTLEGQRVILDSIISTLPYQEKVAVGSDASRYVIQNQVTTTIQQSLTVNQATIVQADWRTDNGIIHVIDRVLMPLFVKG